MSKIRGMISGLFEGAMGMTFMGLIILVALGNLYWLWMSIHIGSFLMFAAAFFPLFTIITGPVGAWSFFFGAPNWVIKIFG